MTQRNWYAVYTKPRWEKKVAEEFRKQKIAHYCPLKKAVCQWSNRRKITLEPLFTSYVFVHVRMAEHPTVRQTAGVLNLVYWLGLPAIIRNEEIEAIKQFLHDQENVTVEKTAVNPADRVRIIDAPLSPCEGTVPETKNKTVKLLLPSLGYTLTAKTSNNKIEALDSMEQACYPENHYGMFAGSHSICTE